MNMKLAIKRNLRIVFMGTPEFAVATLAALLENDYEVVGVITAPDRPAGRGRKLQESAVKQFATQKGLTILQPTNLKNVDFVEELKALNPNLQIVVAFRMLPKVVWQLPQYGTFNLHASLLPDYRGAAPINWAIINGETLTGATTFFIDEHIDTGNIILQKAIPIAEDETAGNLHDRLMYLGAQLVLETVRQIEHNKVKTIKQQNRGILKAAHKISKETCEIDWGKTIDEIYNHIRGLSPFPAAWSTLRNGDDAIFVKIYLADKEIGDHKFKIGKVVFDKKSMKVAVKGGFIQLMEIQLPGRRKMPIQDVLNGVNFSATAYMV
jgi:methionyl-tRNA formyltransferase